jgi:glycine hydroxymethyltransferase
MVMCKERLQRPDRTVFPGIQGGPLVHIIAAKAELKEAFTRGLSEQIVVNAKALASAVADAGFRN